MSTPAPNPNIPVYNFSPAPPLVDPYNPATNPAGLYINISPSDPYRLQFTSDFWRSLDPAVQALWSMPAVTDATSPRLVAFQTLVAAGKCKNDPAILANGEDAYEIIHQRQCYKAAGVDFSATDFYWDSDRQDYPLYVPAPTPPKSVIGAYENSPTLLADGKTTIPGFYANAGPVPPAPVVVQDGSTYVSVALFQTNPFATGVTAYGWVKVS